jgi:methylphosphotriester-DNA--protein-cysteine methyltransferase
MMPDSYKNLLAQLTPSRTGFQSSRPAANRQKFEELADWIWNNLEQKISLTDLLEQSGLSMYELNTQFMFNAKLSPLHFIKELRKYKLLVELENQPVIDQTYALFDPQKLIEPKATFLNAETSICTPPPNLERDEFNP